ncbi:hypothetical protein ACTWPT_24205 [Nonomuraea sp. 3N208]|uniref:hypothetical protein n=1 Tax=Nonomuraea sp. 3N208 TaxID=3457421 RepID=UPI003FD11439
MGRRRRRRIVELTVYPARMAGDVCTRAGRTLTRAEWGRHFEDLPYQDVCPSTGG